MSNCIYSLNYFNKIGKVELCRLLFAVADVNYEDNFIEKITDKDVQVGFMPYLNIGLLTSVPCISTICRFLAREFNLGGQTSIKEAQCDAIAQNCMFLIDTYYRDVNDVENIDAKKINLKNYLENEVNNVAGVVEELVEKYNTSDPFQSGKQFNCYAVGEKLTYADLFIYEMVSKYFPCDSDSLPRDYPNLYRIKEQVESLPNVRKFNEENEYLTPKLSKDVINDISKEE